jgi:hypothetical protein
MNDLEQLTNEIPNSTACTRKTNPSESVLTIAERLAWWEDAVMALSAAEGRLNLS